MKKILKLLLVPLLCSSGAALAREYRTPLSINPHWNGHYHFPWRPDEGHHCWSVDVWGAGLHRDTDKAFLNKDTTKKESLAGIIFNKTSFTLAEAAAPGGFNPLNPLLGVVVFSPRFDYSENAAVFGFTLDRVFGCDCSWHGGLRVNVPFRTIKVALDSCCDLFEGGEGPFCFIQDEQVVTERIPGTEPFIQVVEKAFACRLDFLASLPLTINSPQEKLVKFNNPAQDGHVTFNDIDVTQANPNDVDKNSIHLVKRDNLTRPDAPFSRRYLNNTGADAPIPVVRNDVNAGAVLPFLAADGSGLANEERARFDANTDYTALANNPAAQRLLWVVPTDATTFLGGTPNFGLEENARAIRTAISNVTNNVNADIENVLANLGETFSDQRTHGLGDMYTEIYIHRDWCDYFAEGSIGVTWPTGERIRNPQLLLKAPAGSNGHYQLTVGGVAGWNPNDWFAFRFDAYYTYAFKRKEKVIASFAGATIKNIGGPTIDSSIKWSSFVSDIDFTFMVPCDQNIGFDLGYQFYAKGKDHVKFNQTQAIDVFGDLADLDPSVLARRTKVIAHRVRTEIFHRECNWQLYGGWTQVFAGKNATHDTDWYLGLVVYF